MVMVLQPDEALRDVLQQLMPTGGDIARNAAMCCNEQENVAIYCKAKPSVDRGRHCNIYGKTFYCE